MAQTDKQTHGHGNSMTNSAQWGRVGENNQLLGQPNATSGPAFVPYKLNGKTISSEAEEETMQRGHGSANKINQKTNLKQKKKSR